MSKQVIFTGQPAGEMSLSIWFAVGAWPRSQVLEALGWLTSGLVHGLQITTRHLRGDLRGVEEHFTTWLRFSDDPRYRQLPAVVVSAFGIASWNAWRLGRADVARTREGQMRAAANGNNEYDVAFSEYCAAFLRVSMREYELAEASAARALELSEKNQFPTNRSICSMFSRLGASAARSRDRGDHTD